MSRSREGGPPRAAELLLTLVLPDGAVRETVLGDLEELYRARAKDPERGAAAARWWYRREALRVAAGYGWRRLKGRRYRGLVPDAEPLDSRGWSVADRVRAAARNLRSLASSPGFTIPAVLILALGMTAATSIFTVVDSIVFRPLDLPDSERLVVVCEDHPRLRGACVASPANAADFRRTASTLRELGVARGWPFTLVDADGSEGVRGGLADASFLRALDVRPAAGRLFRADEYGDRNGVALLSHAFWTGRYGRDPEVVGRTVRLSGEPYEVVGVLPRSLELPFDLAGIQVWTPPHVDPTDPDVRGWRGFRAIGRLAPGASVAAAEAELTAEYAALADVHEEIDGEWRLRVDSLRRVVVGDARLVLLAFLAGSGLLLIVVCANVANLFLARGLRRRRELAVRAALGADRRRLVEHVLTESVLLAGVAAGAAVLLAPAVTDLILALAPPGIPRLDEVAVSGRTLAFTVGAAALLTLAFGLVPALRVTSGALGRTLRPGGRGGRDPGSRRLRAGLIVAELCLSVVLLATAGLLTRSFIRYTEWRPGFERDRLLAVSAFVDGGTYPTRDEFMPVFRRVEEAVAALPGVVSTATASAGPLFGGGDGATSVTTEGSGDADAPASAWWFDVGPGYFSTLGVEVVRGREFTEADGPDAPRVAVVNRSLARTLWSDRDPLGSTIHLPEREASFRVVGVVADVPPLTPGEAPRPEIYWSNRQIGRPFNYLLVRTSADASSVARAVEETVTGVAPGISTGTPRSLASAEERALVRPRFQAVVLVALALAALVLSAVGVYAVVSYSVSARVREMGIRVALGASRGRVLSGVLGSTLVIAGAGVALGLLASVAVGRSIRGLVHGVSPTDPVSLAGAALVLLASAVAAAYLPARRATRVDPLDAMRAE